jgi:hypothetical protein
MGDALFDVGVQTISRGTFNCYIVEGLGVVGPL